MSGITERIRQLRLKERAEKQREEDKKSKIQRQTEQKNKSNLERCTHLLDSTNPDDLLNEINTNFLNGKGRKNSFKGVIRRSYNDNQPYDSDTNYFINHAVASRSLSWYRGKAGKGKYDHSWGRVDIVAFSGVGSRIGISTSARLVSTDSSTNLPIGRFSTHLQEFPPKTDEQNDESLKDRTEEAISIELVEIL